MKWRINTKVVRQQVGSNPTRKQVDYLLGAGYTRAEINRMTRSSASNAIRYAVRMDMYDGMDMYDFCD